jgi:hypothetical protein
VAMDFMRPPGKRVLYKVVGSTAPDVKRYSDFPGEEELIMPCGSSFVIDHVEASPQDDELLLVRLKQTGATLLQDLREEMMLEVHQHAALAELHQSLEAAGVASVDCVGRRYEFHQPLPAGFLAIVISRCARLCSEQTSVWRRDLIAVMGVGPPDMDLLQPHLLTLTRKELVAQATVMGVAPEALHEALVGDDAATVEQVKAAVVGLIVSALRIEVSIGQQGVSRVAFGARCHAGGHHALCLRKLRLFESEMLSMIREQWVGCSATIVCTSPAWCQTTTDGVLLTDVERAVDSGAITIACNGRSVPLAELGVQPGVAVVPEGIPPGMETEPELHFEPEPEPELELELEPGPEPELELATEPEPELELA